MGNSIKYYSRDVGQPQSFTAPPWAYQFPTCDSIGPMRHPRLGDAIGWQWMIELGGLRDTYADAEEIRDDLFRLAYGLYDHVKNHCPQHAERARNQKLLWVGYVAGKRENRRLIGDYVLTQNDIYQQTIFPDSVAYGGWSIDDHYANQANNTPVTVRHADGEKTIEIDQRKKPPVEDLFFPIGKFQLDENSTLTVSNTGTDGYVVADAVQLLPLEE